MALLWSSNEEQHITLHVLHVHECMFHKIGLSKESTI